MIKKWYKRFLAPKRHNTQTIKLWMRLGTTLEVTAEQAKKILGGDQGTLEAVLKTKGAWRFDGDSYIPDTITDELCGLLDLNPDDYGYDFNL